MTDRELLELAAKAAGIEGTWDRYADVFVPQEGRIFWNPLNDDGDALRLAVKLRIKLIFRTNLNGEFVYADADGVMFQPQPAKPDPEAATRRAIVRAAAEIGRAKP